MYERKKCHNSEEYQAIEGVLTREDDDRNPQGILGILPSIVLNVSTSNRCKSLPHLFSFPRDLDLIGHNPSKIQHQLRPNLLQISHLHFRKHHGIIHAPGSFRLLLHSLGCGPMDRFPHKRPRVLPYRSHSGIANPCLPRTRISILPREELMQDPREKLRGYLGGLWGLW